MSANTPVSSVSVNDSDTFNLSDAAEQMPDATDNQESPAVTAPAAPPAAPTTPAAPSTKPNGKPSPTPAEKTNPGRGGAKPPKKGPPKSPSGGKATPRNKKGLPKTDPKALPRTIKYIEPPGKEMSLPLKELTLDRRIQMRAALIDEQTVERYKADYQDDDFRDKIPPVKVIELTQDDADRLKLPSRYVVWDGFQRCEARRRAGLKDIPAIVAKGTWGTAVVLALSANSKHGLTRTIADVRKTLMRIIDSQQLQDSILATAAKVGGANRALAAAVQCSKGFVSKVLNSMGKTTRGDKIVNLPESNKTTKRHKRTQGDPAAAMRVESREALASRATANIIRELAFNFSSAQRRVEALLERPDAANLFRELASKFGIAVRVDENPVVKDGKTTTEKVEYWPAVDVPLKFAEELATQHGKLATQAAK